MCAASMPRWPSVGSATAPSSRHSDATSGRSARAWSANSRRQSVTSGSISASYPLSATGSGGSVVGGETLALVERAGARVVVLHLEPGRRRALLKGPAGQGAHHGARQALAAPRRVHLDRHEPRPASVHHAPPDRGGRLALARDRGEPHRGPGAQDLQDVLARVRRPLVAAQPRLVGGARQAYPGDVRIQVADRRERRDLHLGAHLALPARPFELGAELLLGAGGARRGLDVGGQPPGRVPGA